MKILMLIITIPCLASYQPPKNNTSMKDRMYWTDVKVQVYYKEHVARLEALRKAKESIQKSFGDQSKDLPKNIHFPYK